MLGCQSQGHTHHKLEQKTANNEYQKPEVALNLKFSLKNKIVVNHSYLSLHVL